MIFTKGQQDLLHPFTKNPFKKVPKMLPYDIIVIFIKLGDFQIDFLGYLGLCHLAGSLTWTVAPYF